MTIYIIRINDRIFSQLTACRATVK